MKFPFVSTDRQKQDEIEMIAINKIIPNPYQPRKSFDKKGIKELAESIANYGVLQPLTIRKKEDKYELIAGERRLRAAKLNNLKKIPCIVNEFNDKEMAEIALVENLQREDLNFIEESMAYSKLLNKFNLTQSELAQSLGKSQSTIANKLRVLKLSQKVIKLLDPAVITERHARALLKLEHENEQIQVIKKINQNQLTVRETETLIKKMLNNVEDNHKQKITIFGDLRLFENTLNNTIKEMEEAGLEMNVEKEKDEEYIHYHICLPRKQNQN